jgi:5-methylcytosine-specific restriction endonuclease McrA
MKICKQGHEREDSSMVCLVCKRAAKKVWAAKNKERVSEYNKKYAQENSAAIAARMLVRRGEYYKANAESLKEKSAEWYKNNKAAALEAAKIYRNKNAETISIRTAAYRERTKAEQQQRAKLWRQENPDKKLAAHRRRELAKAKRTPVWYCHVDCVAVYKEAKEAGLVVDHIVPLQGKNVSGLHWAHNMQLLTVSANSTKGNKFDPDTYIHELPVY